jgi:hypothetical protein
MTGVIGRIAPLVTAVAERVSQLITAGLERVPQLITGARDAMTSVVNRIGNSLARQAPDAFDLGTAVIGRAAQAGPTVLSKGEQAALNRGLGNAYRDEIAVQFDQMPNRIADIEVYKWTPFGRRYVDVEVSDGAGKVLGGIETKFGKSLYTIGQALKDMWLRREGYRVDVLRYQI